MKSDDYEMPERDLAGNLRVQGAAIDIGAYEVAQEAFVPSSVVELSGARQTCALSFRAGADWRASTSESWLAVVDGEGRGASGLQTVSLSVEANDTGATRTAEVTLRVGTTNCVITVRQLAKVTVPTVSQRYYGLFVGLNEYEYASSLGGCVGDATNLLARCVSHGFWDDEDVSAMTDSQATKAAVRERISRLATSAKAGDVVLLYQCGVDTAKVTVVVSPETKTVTPNGAAVRVVRGESDITDYLNIPAADASGVINLNAATVKEEIAKEPLDAEKGAKVDFSSPGAPSLTTAPTREGLVYRLKEGTTLKAMAADTTGDSKVGDGKVWTPTLSVTGGSSGFYTIQVTK